ncbi:MAG: hypothetical protein QOC94_4483 [Actinoplanes sp.]|jgi:hypothetical protein|nr:hypothetical protein [Actinoplanes sp.]
MSGDVVEFLRLLADRTDLLDSLKTRGKDEVLAAGANLGFTFTENEFDSFVWDAEVRLAKHRDEPFDAQFPLWQTMWGRYYLDYLVTDVISSLEETGLVT